MHTYNYSGRCHGCSSCAYVVIFCVSKSLTRIFILCMVMFMCCSAFQNIKGKGQDRYEYNPCYDFTDGGCVNVAVSKNFNT